MNDVKMRDQKSNIKLPLYGATGLFVFVFSLILVLGFFGREATPKILGSFELFTNQRVFILFSQVLIQSCFSLFSAVLFATYFIRDFNERQDIFPFTHPTRRGRIIWNKMLYVSAWTLATTFSVTLICLGALLLSSAYIPVFKVDDLLLNWPAIFVIAAIASIVAWLVGIISLAIGFRKKSTILTVIFALILCSILSNVLQVENDFVIRGAYTLLICAGLGSLISVVQQAKRIEN